MQAKTHDETRVIVHESDEVHALVLALEREGEQVRLPQLVGPGALEELNLGFVRMRRLLLGDIALFMQHAGNGVGARAVALAAQQHVVDALHTPILVTLLEHQDRAARGLGQA